MAEHHDPGSNTNKSVSPPPSKRRKFESTTTKKAVTSFFTPASKKEPERTTWQVVNESLLFGRYRPDTSNHSNTLGEIRRKIAAFDLDSTLIKTSSGNIFSKNATDWQWWDLSVPSTLKRLYSEGYAIAILTNQGSISLKNDPRTLKADQRSLANFKSKVGAVFAHFDFPILLLAATGRDRYRKPRTGMWGEVLEEFDLNEGGVDLEGSFFVGDAGGRAARGSTKADHACSDRDFATNVGIKFETPEEFFLNEEPAPFVRTFEPTEFLAPALSALTDATPLLIEKKNTLDVIIMCGSPGSGKSTFYWTKLKPLGYERVNQDTLKTRDRCLQVAASLLPENKSVAVDNTNADSETRAVWVQLARKHNISIRCVHFTAPVKLCEHNDTIRALAGNGFNPEMRTILPHSAFAGFRSRFKAPQVHEGFQDVVKIDFQFQGDEEARRLWSLYWI